jgi:hypothetical protein
MGLGKAALASNSMAASQWPVLFKKRISGHALKARLIVAVLAAGDQVTRGCLRRR